MSYTKLFNSIISSTIWTEDDKTRIIWVTMMAMADQNGEIQASIPGLARMASAVTITKCRVSLFLTCTYSHYGNFRRCLKNTASNYQ